MHDSLTNAFNLLDLEPNVDKDRIRRAYKKRIQKLHPDRNIENTAPQKQQEFQDVLNAYKLISEALSNGELAKATANRERERSSTESESESAPRPFSAGPSIRRQFASERFYQTDKPTSAVKFVGAVVVIASVLVLGFASFAAWQKSTSGPTRQWDPAYHENKARGLHQENS